MVLYNRRQTRTRIKEGELMICTTRVQELRKNTWNKGNFFADWGLTRRTGDLVEGRSVMFTD